MIWSPISAAGAESAFSGILAGFVFLGMIAIWTVEHPESRKVGEWANKRTYALQFFAVAFIVLALDSYITAITSGETDCNRASVEEAFSGGALGIGAAVMLAGLAWQLVTLSEQVDELKKILRWMLSGLGLLIVVMIAISAVGIGEQLLGRRNHTFVDAAPWILGVGLLVAAVVAALRRHGYGEPKNVDRAVLVASLSVLADGILSALFGGIGGAVSTGFWAAAPATLIDAIVVLMVLMPGIALVATAGPAIFAVVKDENDSHDPSASVASSSGAAQDAAASGPAPSAACAQNLSAPEGVHPDRLSVEPMTTTLLRQRSLDTFSGGYLTFIAIIQGVALAVLADRAVGLLTDDIHTGWTRVEVAGQTASCFMALLIVTYEYLWFTSIMGWPLTFIDTLVPYTLGAGEIVAAQLLGRGDTWWASFAALSVVGVLAFMRTHIKCAAVVFEHDGKPHPHIRAIIRRLTVRLMGCCGALAAWSLIVIWMSDRPGHWPNIFLACAAWTPAFASLVLVALSEHSLTQFYKAFDLDRLGRHPGHTHAPSSARRPCRRPDRDEPLNAVNLRRHNPTSNGHGGKHSNAEPALTTQHSRDTQ